MPSDPRIHFTTEAKPSLFFGLREYSFFNNISMELIEVVIQQTVKYYAVEEKYTKIHELYKESKEKVTRPPVQIYARVMYNEPTQTTGQYADRQYAIDVYFQKERLWRDLNMNPRTGDFIEWDGKFFEIATVTEPQITDGLPEFKFAIICSCIGVRQGVFSPGRQGTGDITYNTNENETKR